MFVPAESKRATKLQISINFKRIGEIGSEHYSVFPARKYDNVPDNVIEDLCTRIGLQKVTDPLSGLDELPSQVWKKPGAVWKPAQVRMEEPSAKKTQPKGNEPAYKEKKNPPATAQKLLFPTAIRAKDFETILFGLGFRRSRAGYFHPEVGALNPPFAGGEVRDPSNVHPAWRMLHELGEEERKRRGIQQLYEKYHREH